jgi:transcriptional regulator with XRE-family HTH domain
MQNKILETIKQIEREKRAARLVPFYCTLFELCKRLNLPETQILCELERAKAAGVFVKVGNTINGKYIALQKIENYL